MVFVRLWGKSFRNFENVASFGILHKHCASDILRYVAEDAFSFLFEAYGENSAISAIGNDDIDV